MNSKKSNKRGLPSFSSSKKNSKKSKGDISAFEKFPTPTQFRQSAMPQEFSLPKPIMKYIWENPSTPEVYEKLIQCCKLFFLKNPMLVLKNLKYIQFENFYYENGWKRCISEECRNNYFCKQQHRNFDMYKFYNKKLWISKTFSVLTTSDNKSRVASDFITKIHRYNVKILELYNEELTYNELKFLAVGVKEVNLYWNTVKDGNGEMVPLEKIVKAFSGADKFFINFGDFTDNAVCKCYDYFIEACNTIKKVLFHLIPDSFNVCKFYHHLKLSKNRTLIEICCRPYNNNLDEVMDEILATASFEFVPPVIYYLQCDQPKLKKMYEIQAIEAAKYH